MQMPSTNANDSYKNADYFGPMLLKDINTSSIEMQEGSNEILLYPIPAENLVKIKLNKSFAIQKEIEVLSMSGRSIKKIRFQEDSYNLNIEDLKSGSYLLRINDGNTIHSMVLLKN